MKKIIFGEKIRLFVLRHISNFYRSFMLIYKLTKFTKFFVKKFFLITYFNNLILSYNLINII